MKRFAFLCVCVGLCIGNLSAIDAVQFEVIGTYEDGRGSNSFRYYHPPAGGDSVYPRSMTYSTDSTLYSGDPGNGRIIKLGTDGSWSILQEKVDPGERILVRSQYLFIFGYPGTYRVFDQESSQIIKDTVFQITFGDSGFYHRTIITGDMILVNTSPEYGSETPRYFGFQIPEDFDGTITMMDPEQTIDFLKNDYQGTEEFTVDEDGYIFWNGKLVAPNGNSYAKYFWNATYRTIEWQATIVFSQFIGWDGEGNTYWNSYNRISVLSPQGESVAFFDAENVNETNHSQFAVTPEGTLYCLSYNADNDEFELMKLDRFW